VGQKTCIYARAHAIKIANNTESAAWLLASHINNILTNLAVANSGLLEGKKLRNSNTHAPYCASYNSSMYPKYGIPNTRTPNRKGARDRVAGGSQFIYQK